MNFLSLLPLLSECTVTQVPACAVYQLLTVASNCSLLPPCVFLQLMSLLVFASYPRNASPRNQFGKQIESWQPTWEPFLASAGKCLRAYGDDGCRRDGRFTEAPLWSPNFCCAHSRTLPHTPAPTRTLPHTPAHSRTTNQNRGTYSESSFHDEMSTWVPFLQSVESCIE